ncbi:hypothetical protein B484DRAFT_390537 [Ochromonadaceae sp. CCMP2298]|nr:hypothetical protein B484DRAFT_390537 [Ochromonadaceae sp. CCMP2298]
MDISCNLAAAEVLKSLTDADAHECSHSSITHLPTIVLAFLAIPVVVGLYSEFAGELAFDTLLPCFLSMLVLAHYLAYTLHPLVLILPYCIFLFWAIVWTFQKPSHRRLRKKVEKGVGWGMVVDVGDMGMGGVEGRKGMVRQQGGRLQKVGAQGQGQGGLGKGDGFRTAARNSTGRQGADRGAGGTDRGGKGVGGTEGKGKGEGTGVKGEGRGLSRSKGIGRGMQASTEKDECMDIDMGAFAFTVQAETDSAGVDPGADADADETETGSGGSGVCVDADVLSQVPQQIRNMILTDWRGTWELEELEEGVEGEEVEEVEEGGKEEGDYLRGLVWNGGAGMGTATATVTGVGAGGVGGGRGRLSSPQARQFRSHYSYCRYAEEALLHALSSYRTQVLAGQLLHLSLLDEDLLASSDQLTYSGHIHVRDLALMLGDILHYYRPYGNI